MRGQNTWHLWQLILMKAEHFSWRFFFPKAWGVGTSASSCPQQKRPHLQHYRGKQAVVCYHASTHAIESTRSEKGDVQTFSKKNAYQPPFEKKHGEFSEWGKNGGGQQKKEKWWKNGNKYKGGRTPPIKSLLHEALIPFSGQQKKNQHGVLGSLLQQ